MIFPSSAVGKRLVLQVLVIATLLIFGFAISIGFFTYSRELDAFERKFSLIGQSHLDVIESALWVDDQENLRIALLSICRIPGIESAAIQAREEVVCRAGQSAAPGRLHRVFPITHLYDGETYRLGELHIQGSLSHVRHKALKTALSLMAAQTSIILVVCALLLMLIYRAVIRRLLAITSYTSSFSMDDLDRELQLDARKGPVDEVDHLAYTIDQMRLHLRRAFARKDEIERELRRHQHDLERIVDQRTASLKFTVEKLRHEIDQRSRMEKEREELIRDLQHALGKVNKLGGLLPICAHCKKIRDDKGYWNQVEAYIGDRSEAEFSHSICPECARTYYPDYDLFGSI